MVLITPPFRQSNSCRELRSPEYGNDTIAMPLKRRFTSNTLGSKSTKMHKGHWKAERPPALIALAELAMTEQH